MYICEVINKSKSSQELGNGVYIVSSAFKSRVVAKRQHLELADFFTETRDKMIQLIRDQRDKLNKKVNMELFALYTIEAKSLTDVKSFNTPIQIITLEVRWMALWMNLRILSIKKCHNSSKNMQAGVWYISSTQNLIFKTMIFVALHGVLSRLSITNRS